MALVAATLENKLTMSLDEISALNKKISKHIKKEAAKGKDIKNLKEKTMKKNDGKQQRVSEFISEATKKRDQQVKKKRAKLNARKGLTNRSFNYRTQNQEQNVKSEKNRLKNQHKGNKAEPKQQKQVPVNNVVQERRQKSMKQAEQMRTQKRNAKFNKKRGQV